MKILKYGVLFTFALIEFSCNKLEEIKNTSYKNASYENDSSTGYKSFSDLDIPTSSSYYPLVLMYREIEENNLDSNLDDKQKFNEERKLLKSLYNIIRKDGLNKDKSFIRKDGSSRDKSFINVERATRFSIKLQDFYQEYPMKGILESAFKRLAYNMSTYVYNFIEGQYFDLEKVKSERKILGDVDDLLSDFTKVKFEVFKKTHIKPYNTAANDIVDFIEQVDRNNLFPQGQNVYYIAFCFSPFRGFVNDVRKVLDEFLTLTQDSSNKEADSFNSNVRTIEEKKTAIENKINAFREKYAIEINGYYLEQHGFRAFYDNSIYKFLSSEKIKEYKKWLDDMIRDTIEGDILGKGRSSGVGILIEKLYERSL